MDTKGAKVSIIIPVVHEDRVHECISAIKMNAGVPSSDYEIVTEVDKDIIGCPKMVRKLVNKTKHDYVMFLGDDTIPQENFLKIALERANDLQDGWGLVGLNDGINNGNIIATHWLAHKKLLDYLEDRDFFYTGYVHQYCDKELTDKAIELGRYVWASDAKLIHNHPIRDIFYNDENYIKSYSDINTRRDQRLYLKRRKENGYFKLGIGFPVTDDKVFTSFLVSWTVMDKPNFTLLVPKFVGPIETIRNNLVIQALREQCTHLIMMDTDQNYPVDTIPKLLSHNRDVVTGLVHRRYPPFDVIMLRGELGKYHHIADGECFSGGLVEVDATGCACAMFNTDVFLDISYPWFEQYRMEDGRAVGEDVDFCSKLRQNGYRIFVDTSIVIGHISCLEITREFYLLYKKIKGFDWAQPGQAQ